MSGVLSCFGGDLFFAFAVMVWVLSGVVGGGWFWGGEGLGLKGWGFGGFSRMPVVVVPWWWSVVPWWFVVVVPQRGGGPVVVVLLW